MPTPGVRTSRFSLRARIRMPTPYIIVISNTRGIMCEHREPGRVYDLGTTVNIIWFNRQIVSDRGPRRQAPSANSSFQPRNERSRRNHWLHNNYNNNNNNNEHHKCNEHRYIGRVIQQKCYSLVSFPILQMSKIHYFVFE